MKYQISFHACGKVHWLFTESEDAARIISHTLHYSGMCDDVTNIEVWEINRSKVTMPNWAPASKNAQWKRMQEAYQGKWASKDIA